MTIFRKEKFWEEGSKIKKKIFALLVLGIVLSPGLSCEKKEPTLAGSRNEPAWVSKCAGAFPDAGRDAFYGCAGVNGIPDEAQRMQTADQRARADLDRVIESYSADFFQSFVASAAIQEKARLTNLQKEQLLQVLPREVTERALYGVQIIDRWQGPQDSLYSIARISFDTLRQAMETQIQVHSSELKLEANEAMDELDRQLEKRRESGK